MELTSSFIFFKPSASYNNLQNITKNLCDLDLCARSGQLLFRFLGVSLGGTLENNLTAAESTRKGMRGMGSEGREVIPKKISISERKPRLLPISPWEALR